MDRIGVINRTEVRCERLVLSTQKEKINSLKH